MLKKIIKTTILPLLFICLVTLVPAYTNAKTGSENKTGKQTNFNLNTGVKHFFETDIDDGGEFNLTRYSVGAQIENSISNRLSTSIGANYSYTEYDFSGNGSFTGLDPWDDVNNAGLNLGLRYSISQKWGLFTSHFINFSGESGADFKDSLSVGGIAGFSYSPNRNFYFGLGLIVASRIEDDVIVFPIPFFNWHINERLRLSTTGGETGSGTRGQLELSYYIGSGLTFGVGAGFSSDRFRLDDSGIADNGVGELQIAPVTASVSYNLNQNIRVNLYGGAGFFGELELEDSSGDRISEEDFDTVPIIGGNLAIKF